jgi:membrane protein YqaA with SNARE-associated domain
MSAVYLFGVEAVQTAVETATGWIGLTVVWLYSFLVATVLPLPIQAVLVAPVDSGLAPTTRYMLVVLTSALGTTMGSLFAFHCGQGVKQWCRIHINSRLGVPRILEPVAGRLRGRIDADADGILDRSARSMIDRWGYLGLFVALSIPFFPHKTSVYAVSMLDDDYRRFGLAVFGGATGRLVITLAVAAGVLSVIR